VYKNIVSLLVRNESVALLVVKPLYCTFIHMIPPKK